MIVLPENIKEIMSRRQKCDESEFDLVADALLNLKSETRIARGAARLEYRAGNINKEEYDSIVVDANTAWKLESNWWDPHRFDSWS